MADDAPPTGPTMPSPYAPTSAFTPPSHPDAPIETDPGVFSSSLLLSEAEFEAAASDALDLIPGELVDAMDNVVVLVEDEPEAELLGPDDVGEDGLATLLGLYDGIPLTERDDTWSLTLPDRILIFRGPLSRWCRNREELVEEIAVTVIHEIAHHFGIDDDRLAELGWD